jgi:hypothetical protein
VEGFVWKGTSCLDASNTNDNDEFRHGERVPRRYSKSQIVSQLVPRLREIGTFPHVKVESRK